ncbi:MAG: MBL fold metallo-hydrolase [Nitrososphaerota archaeon]|nr:MBL fold metallo-hydrolase [Nitrososphaerota archaeon]
MSTIKSYSVGNGDMFYIDHNSDNFTIIDCYLPYDRQEEILHDLANLCDQKGVNRFISTHPDDDHIRGLEHLDNRISIQNFYCVKNAATKPDKTDSFDRYCALRDSDKAFLIKKACTRRWMNKKSDERGSSGINVLWPNTNNEQYKNALKMAEDGGSANNISAIIKYSLDGGPSVLWMGDLETEFMEAVKGDLNLLPVDILFAPHHGRESGKIPDTMLTKLAPKIIVVGEAPSEHLNYYKGYNTITQNSAGDIIFECEAGRVHVFTSNDCSVDFLCDESQNRKAWYYLGTLNL